MAIRVTKCYFTVMKLVCDQDTQVSHHRRFAVIRGYGLNTLGSYLSLSISQGSIMYALGLAKEELDGISYVMESKCSALSPHRHNEQDISGIEIWGKRRLVKSIYFKQIRIILCIQ